MNWAANQRQSYISERVRNVGALNRFDIQKEFNVSAQQASSDIAHFYVMRDQDDCICEAPLAGPTDIDPPEVKLNRNCPVHGIDPDYLRDLRDDK